MKSKRELNTIEYPNVYRYIYRFWLYHNYALRLCIFYYSVMMHAIKIVACSRLNSKVCTDISLLKKKLKFFFREIKKHISDYEINRECLRWRTLYWEMIYWLSLFFWNLKNYWDKNWLIKRWNDIKWNNRIYLII
jgi:hypothetical protein